MKTPLYILTVLLFSLVFSGASAEPSPATFEESKKAGLEAEMVGQWEQALEIYQSLLQQDPSRADLWLRVADIHWSQGNSQAVAEALEKAAPYLPDDHALQFRLSQVYSELEKPQKAFDAIERALVLDPNNTEYLNAKGSLANWLSKYKVASKSFQRVVELSPDEEQARLNLARSQMWGGDLDEAAATFRDYCDRHPDDKQVLMDYIKVETWRGDYVVALEALERYRERFGEEEIYQREKARLLAWAGRPTKAMYINNTLLDSYPNDYELNYTRTVALKGGNRPREAVESLDKLEAIRPESEDTADINRYIRTSLRSNINLGAFYANDSDDISIRRLELFGAHFLNPETQLQAGVEGEDLRAKRGSGLETIKGHSQISHKKLWIGAEHRYNPKLLLSGRLGNGKVSGKSKHGIYRLGVEYQPADNWRVNLRHDRDLYALSPRSVSLKIRQSISSLDLSWQPNLRYFIDGGGSYSRFSDHNSRWEFQFAPRRAVYRGEDLNLDLGVSGHWFGFKKDLNNGYWDPEWYRRYAATAFTYWKIDDDNGISAAFSLGWHKDNSMGSYKFGEDVVLDGFFGIYRDWMLRVRLGYAERFGEAGGGYDGYTAYVTVVRRF